ncbi:NAD(P)-dependent dehydrogenase, short-chain alcohol dehydrogenase family [Rhizobium sp. NFR07]|uniref:SDR family oxidoreductase n=1 Tax=Rhizobium sp. NFR07 TaxID=1566262 RepID=UPI0008EE95F9|nr:SDR family oxidoreductase [Rhizobium sp. NFR07]SFB02655.1 NAD(P)-dependent dehydrogenase, short-chain alcohol dehydrogenase family [Rhizobium sp. NFR07]
MGLLENKVAVITGASSGIGRAAAMLFSAEGARVVLNGRNSAALDDVVDSIRAHGGQAVAVAGDVGLAETHARLVAQALHHFGALDIAFNNAASVGPLKPLADVELAEWQATIATTFTSAFLASRYQIPAMVQRGAGTIIFTSSFVGTSVGLPGMAVYAAAKAGLMGLVKGITADYASRGIRANALLPGGVDTPMAGDDSQKAWAAGLHAVKRIAQPEEIANAALFLASSMSSFVRGSALFADGGNSAVK